MKPTQVAKDIWWVGVNDRTTPRFENLWTLPRGVSYNSYLVMGSEKTALIDGALSDYFDIYLEHIESVLGGRKLDYLIINHMEPDHSSAIELLRKFFPDITIVTNKIALGLLQQFYADPGATLAVAENDELDLGGLTLQFAMVPNVHWPETMVTFEKTTGTLFSCDAFGAYGALDGSVFEEELDRESLVRETRRYYATIVGRFNPFVQKALQKVKALPLKVLCPSHGPVYREGIADVLALYDRMSRQDTVEGAVVVYGSMYGHTARMAEACAEGLRDAGVKPVHMYDISDADIADVIGDVWHYRGLALFACCYNMGMFPAMKPLVDKMVNCKVSGRVLALGGNYSWSKGKELEPLLAFKDTGEFDLAGDVIEVKSTPTKEDLAACRELGRSMGEKIKAHCAGGVCPAVAD